jgi:uncharacterized protein (TIGR02757 family)
MTAVTDRDTMLRDAMEDLYSRLNHRQYVHPDPLEFPYAYDDVRDREIVGLVASSLAYGRVAQILRSVASVLERMPSPARFLADATPASLGKALQGFKHRFTTGQDLAGMLLGAKRAIERHGSLEACFARGFDDSHDDITPALSRFVSELCDGEEACRTYLLPPPEAGSACKRLNLYLRWMVRRDEVDPGGWERLPASKLIVPLDTHMHRFARALGMTFRKQADLRAAVEITAAFRRINAEDPVKYDFALTRLGIRSDMDPRSFLERCAIREVT